MREVISAAELVSEQEDAKRRLREVQPKRSDIGIDRDDVTDVLLATAEPEGGNHVLLYGPRGTGKTTSATRARFVTADGKPQPVYSITLTSEQSAASLWGHWMPKGDQFVWNDGPMLRAWREGALLVINEIDHASEDVQNVLHVLLDDPEVAQITLPTGETVRPGKGFRCIATMNGYPEDVSEPVLDRFSLTVNVASPSTEMIEALPEDLREEARWQYKHVDEERGEPAVTYRQLEMFAALRKTLPAETAAALVFGYDASLATQLVKAAASAVQHVQWERQFNDPEAFNALERAWEKRHTARENALYREKQKISDRYPNPPKPDVVQPHLPEQPKDSFFHRRDLTAWQVTCDRIRSEADHENRNAMETWYAEIRRLEQTRKALIRPLQEHYTAEEKSDPQPMMATEPKLQHVQQKQEKFSKAKLSPVNRDELGNYLKTCALPEGGMHALLFGPPGTGKTSAAVAAALQSSSGTQPVFSVTLTSEQSAASLWGHWVPKGDSFVWNDGPFLMAWREGALLVVNELNHASEDVSNMLHVLLDNPEVAQVTLPTGETVRPHAGFRCIATMNGSIDDDVAPAVLDRFSIISPVIEPSSTMIDALPEHLRDFAKYLYSDKNHDRLEDGSPAITYRTLSKFGKLLEDIPEPFAASVATHGDLQKAQSLLEASVGGRAKLMEQTKKHAPAVSAPSPRAEVE
ncbi:MAG: AAA family ATPase [Candidatus Dormibacteria bacterium]